MPPCSTWISRLAAPDDPWTKPRHSACRVSRLAGLGHQAPLPAAACSQALPAGETIRPRERLLRGRSTSPNLRDLQRARPCSLHNLACSSPTGAAGSRRGDLGARSASRARGPAQHAASLLSLRPSTIAAATIDGADRALAPSPRDVRSGRLPRRPGPRTPQPRSGGAGCKRTPAKRAGAADALVLLEQSADPMNTARRLHSATFALDHDDGDEAQPSWIGSPSLARQVGANVSAPRRAIGLRLACREGEPQEVLDRLAVVERFDEQCDATQSGRRAAPPAPPRRRRLLPPPRRPNSRDGHHHACQQPRPQPPLLSHRRDRRDHHGG
jgi:hypothetical protein